MAHKGEQGMTSFVPFGLGITDVEREYPMRDILAVTHGKRFARIYIFEQRGLILSVQWRTGGDHHPLNVRGQAIKIKCLAQHDLDDASGTA